MKKSQPKTISWRICILIASLLAILGLSPAVIPPGVFHPTFLGMPYSMWTGMLVTICLILMTYIGSRVHPGSNHENKDL